MKKVILALVVLALVAVFVGCADTSWANGFDTASEEVQEATKHLSGGITEGVRVRDMERNGVKYTLFFNEDGYLVSVVRVD